MSRNVIENKVKIDLVENPIPINYEEIPEYTKEDYEERIEKVLVLAEEKGFSHLIIYGDREHFSNIHYLTGLDPRFEEALLILEKGKKPKIVLGNECMQYSGMISLDLDKVLYHPFNLLGQPGRHDYRLVDIFKDSGIVSSSKVGITGWKYYEPEMHELDVSILDIPNYIVETLCLITERKNLINAMDIFTDNDYGLRHNISAKEIVNFEMAGTKASRNVYNVIKNLEEGMLEIEASKFLHIDGEPTTMHPNINFGDNNTSLGVRSATYHQKLRLGDTICVGMAHRGSLVHKGGVFINSPEDLTDKQKEVREHFYHTYFKSVVAYYENFKIGNTCGDIFDVVDKTLGDGQSGGIKKFHIGLSLGHLIHTEEWSSSPFFKGSKTLIRSGMNVQCDYTVMHKNPYLTAHIEDGFVVADKELRDEVKEISPTCYKRIEARRKFMKEVLNIHLPEEILPLSDLAGVCFPYMADVSTVLCME